MYKEIEKNLNIGRYSNHLYLMHSDGNGDGSDMWLDSFRLASKNNEVIHLGEILQTSGLSGLSKEIEDNIIQNQISLLLIETSTPLLNPFFILYLKKKYKLMVVSFAMDDEYKFEWISSIYATLSDIVLSFDYVSVARYRQAGINAFLFMHPIDISYQTLSKKNHEYNNDVAFVGKVDDKIGRKELLEYLKSSGIDTKVYASNSHSDPSFLSVDDMYGVYSSSKINLSFSGITPFGKFTHILGERIRGLKARPFEIALVNGFCLCEFSISTSQWLEHEKEIVFFYSKEDLIEKIQYYLANPDEAQKIARAGSLKVVETLTAKPIAKKFLKYVNETENNIGKDLYGNPQKLKISRWFAHSFIEFTFPKSLELLFKGKLKIFFHDSRYLLKFINQLFFSIGLPQTLQVIIISIYRMIKTLLAKAKFW